MDNQRKHWVQMSDAEFDRVVAEVKQVRSLELSTHAAERCVEKGISDSDIARAFRKHRVVEAHINDPNDLRVVLRGKPNRNNVCVCIVISLLHHEVVTVYPNHKDDNHRTIDWGNYLWDTDLESYLNKLQDRAIRPGASKKRWK